MSTAIMHNTASLYDFGDFFLKNQTSSRSSSSSNSNNSNSSGTSSPTSNNGLSNSQLLTNILGSSMQSLLTNNTINTATLFSNTGSTNSLQQLQQINNNFLNNNFNQAVATAAAITNPSLLQQHINAVVVQQQQHQQQEQKKLWGHNTLSRTVSHPQNGNVVSIMNTLIDNLSDPNTLVENMSNNGGSGPVVGGHRKLERTQSEPLPQGTNASNSSSRYKTELCRPYEEEGECKYGAKCQFAHGVRELRVLQRHPKYKTELCRTFHKLGICPYGTRCHFIHKEEENKTNIDFDDLTGATIGVSNGSAGAIGTHPLPLSPPLSMSTGSDRASPAGSLSLSTTNSMTFPFTDQVSPVSSVFEALTLNTPPASPQSGMSTFTIPSPPPSGATAAQIIPQTQQLSQNLNGGIYIQQQPQQIQNCGKHSLPKFGGSNQTNTGETRLPVFNRLSSKVGNTLTYLSI